MSGCATESLNAPATSKNQLSGLSYDAAGNVTNDGLGNTPTYDGENRIITDAGVTYSYDADGFRMKKSSGTLYWPDASGNVLSESNTSGTINEDYVYFNGARIARIDRPSGSVHYYFSDHLGSASVIASSAGIVQQQYFYYPFGGMQAAAGSDSNHFKFTGKERDSESGLDNFGARYNASSLGRFMTPDPLGGSLGDPQTLNKYAYVRNNPVTLTDPTGLYTCRDDPKDGSSHCASDADKKFENTLAGLRNSSDAYVARAAAAYGAANSDNGVTVGFADLSTKGENGNTVSTLGSDSQGNLRANSDVTINSKINGDSYAAAIGHEGSHAADAQDVVRSGITGGLLAGQPIYAGMDITHYQSEVRAWGVTQSILKSGNFTQAFDCGTSNCTLGANVAIGNDKKLPAQLGEVFDRILANQKIYNQGGKPMGPGNQGGNIVNGVSLTPKVTVPH